ncbi:MAG: two-component sensor histidine kinase, partial [Deltaproteobacteria bacterium]
MVITCTVLMGALFVVLLFVVKRGEAIIEQRAEERLRLKEQLGRAERLSAMGEMAAGISHEIRNPLGIIRSSAELLKKKVAKIDPTSAIPDIIIEEATRLNGIITDFINF